MEESLEALDFLVDESKLHPDVLRVVDKLQVKLSNWESYWVPYSELTNEIQEYDRIWARKVLEVIKESNDR